MIHVGFTGTRFGMSEKQFFTVLGLMATEGGLFHGAVTGHHGDCVGADSQFHDICRRLEIRVIGHPPVDQEHRAFCRFDEERPLLTHMKRNRAIVAESQIMIATPYDPAEPGELVGGTWKTVGMTRKALKPLILVMPNGHVLRERWSNVSSTDRSSQASIILDLGARRVSATDGPELPDGGYSGFERDSSVDSRLPDED